MSTLSQFFLSPGPTIANNEVDGRQTIEGGWYICRGPVGNAWIAATLSAEVSRTWYCRDDAVTRAQAVTGCTGWFVPTRAQLQNPGVTCKEYWYVCTQSYWSSNERNASIAYAINMLNGTFSNFSHKSGTNCVRAFRCVTY